MGKLEELVAWVNDHSADLDAELLGRSRIRRQLTRLMSDIEALSVEFHRDDEEWMPAVGYESSCEVSNYGRLRSLDRYVKRKDGVKMLIHGKVLVQHATDRGHMRVCLPKDGGTKKEVFAHRLALEAFDRPPLPGELCRHLDGNPRNNHVSNLKWGTVKENAADAMAHGVSGRGEASAISKLKEADVREIRRANEPQKDLAQRFNVSVATVTGIQLGSSWGWFEPETIRREKLCKHATEEQVRYIAASDKTSVELATELGLRQGHIESIRGGRSRADITGIQRAESNRKLTAQDARDIVASGEPIRALSERYGVHEETIGGILRGTVWSKATGVQRKISKRMSREDILYAATSTDDAQIVAAKLGVSRGHVFRIRQGRNYPEVTGIEYKPASRLSEAQILEIAESTESVKALQDRFNRSETFIRHIRSGKRHSDVTGLTYSPSGIVKLVKAQVLQIVASDMSANDLAEEFNVNPDAIRAVRRGESWSELTGIKFEASKKAKLTEDQILAIAASDSDQDGAARKYGVCRATIYNIRNGQSYSAITGIKKKT